MAFVYPFIVRTNYNELLKKIDELKDVDKDLKKKLREIVVALRGISNNVKQISKAQMDEQNETKLWDNYQELQKERLFFQPLSYEWDAYAYSARIFPLGDLIQGAINELDTHTRILKDTLRAHIDILEIRNSRENRKAMRKLSSMALVISAVFFYVTVWKDFALGFISNLKFPWGLSPYLNEVILLLLLVPLVWFLIRTWCYLIKE